MPKDEISPTLFEKYDAYAALKTKMMKNLQLLKIGAICLITLGLGYFAAELTDMLNTSEFPLTV